MRQESFPHRRKSRRHGQGKYDEAEELYKKIANKEDVFGDASAHYGYLLDEMGRYEEADDHFCQALKGDTSPAEGVEVFLNDSMQDEDSPYWHYRCYIEYLSRYLETCDSIGKKPDFERILLNCLKSKDQHCVSIAISNLIQMYGTGKLTLLINGEYHNEKEVDVAVPDLEKLKKIVAEAVKDKVWVSHILSCLCNDWENVDEVSAKALEAALLAVSFEEAKKKAYNMLFCLYLFGRALDGYSGDWINVPYLENRQKALELMSKMNFEQVIGAVFTGYDEDCEKIAEFLEEAHRAYPDDEHIAYSMLLNVKAGRFSELIGTLSDNCVQGLFSSYPDVGVFFLDGGIEIEDAEEFEAYYTSLLDFLDKYEMHDEIYNDTQMLMLSAYQFGVYLNNSCEYEMSELEDHQKAKDFAEKYGIELLSEPYDVDLF